MHDVDHDGVLDIILATYNGEVLFYNDMVSNNQQNVSSILKSDRMCVG